MEGDPTTCALTGNSGKPGGLAGHIVGDWADGPVDYLAGTTLRANGRRVAKTMLPWARWNLRTGEVREIQVGSLSLGATGLLPDDTVVLNAADGPMLWTDAGTTKLPVPAGYDDAQVTGVGGNRLLVGTAVDRGGKFNAFRWDCG